MVPKVMTPLLSVPATLFTKKPVTPRPVGRLTCVCTPVAALGPLLPWVTV